MTEKTKIVFQPVRSGLSWEEIFRCWDVGIDIRGGKASIPELFASSIITAASAALKKPLTTRGRQFLVSREPRRLEVACGTAPASDTGMLRVLLSPLLPRPRLLFVNYFVRLPPGVPSFVLTQSPWEQVTFGHEPSCVHDVECGHDDDVYL